MAKRLKLILVAMLLCLSFSFAFAGVASAKTTNASTPLHSLIAGLPHINDVPSHVPNSSGCYYWTVYGKNWLPGDVVNLYLNDQPAFGNYLVIADGTGHFVQSVSACGFSPGKYEVDAASVITLEVAIDRVTFLP